MDPISIYNGGIWEYGVRSRNSEIANDTIFHGRKC